MFGIVILRERVDRFHLNLTGSLIACNTDKNNLEWFCNWNRQFWDLLAFQNNMEHWRSSNLFCFSVTLADACLVYITFPPWHSTIFVCHHAQVMVEKLKYTENSQTCTDGLFQGLKLLVTHLIQYCILVGVQRSTKSLSFDLRSKSCRMRRQTHSKVCSAIHGSKLLKIHWIKNTLFKSI